MRRAIAEESVGSAVSASMVVVDFAALLVAAFALPVLVASFQVDAASSTRATSIDKLLARGAVDDPGTGYAPLAYLKRFPIDTMKIDASFIDDIGRRADDAAITWAIVAFGRGRTLTAIAAGMQTQAQASFSLAHGCHIAHVYRLCSAAVR